MVERRHGSSFRAIATLLGRAPSTVSREMARNAAVDAVTGYDATAAAGGYRDRRRRCVRRRKLEDGTRLHRRVSDWLIYRHWSPQQIASRLRRMHPNNPSFHVSHETIYAAIDAHPRGALKQSLVEALRQHKPQRGRRRRTAAGAGGMVIPEDLRIRLRPAQVAERKLPGHWEGDFIKGAYNRSAVGTLVERNTRFVVLCKMNGCGAEAALNSFTRQMKNARVPARIADLRPGQRDGPVRSTIQVPEDHLWFADPYAPWQRGSYVPKQKGQKGFEVFEPSGKRVYG